MERLKMHNLYKGVAHPWLCDAMGHLNVRHYLGMFDDANFHLLSEAFGWDPVSPEWAGKGWADISHDIRYREEIHAGRIVEIWGGFLSAGNSSVTTYLEMTDKMRAVTFACLTAKIVFFDLVARKALPLSQVMRLSMAPMVLNPA